MKDKLKEALKKVLKEIDADIEPLIERPKDSNFGDYTTNVALILAKKNTRNPSEVAKELVEKLNKEKIEGIGEVNAASGFINFKLSDSYLQNQIPEIIKADSNYGSSAKFNGKKAKVEFISANPTGPLHIGNARGGPIGDVLANVLEKVGYKVTREYLHNNVGGQVKQLGQTIYYTIYPDKKNDEELFYKGEYIKKIADKIKSQVKEGMDFEKVGSIAVEILLSEIMEDVKAMGIKFDEVRKESDLREKIPTLIENLEKKTVVKEKDGALWFAPSDEFLKDRETVVRKSDGEFTYFASDIVYHKEKFEGKTDLVIDVLGANHFGHVPRLKAAINSLGFDVDKFKVILYELVRIKRNGLAVKMSKRQGDFVTAREVLGIVGKDAFRYFLLTTAPSTHMDFDVDLASKKVNDNPVFYVQYAYSRISSIIKKTDKIINPKVELLKEREETELIRHLIKFPELVEEISQSFSVHFLTTYSYQLANLFHKLYESHKVLSENKDLTAARLSLLTATKIVLENSLNLLGIEAPERM